MSLKQRVRGAVAILRGTPVESTRCDLDTIEKDCPANPGKKSGESDGSEPLDNLQAVVEWMSDNILLVLTITGVIGGIGFGLIGRVANFSSDTIMLISFPGEILMRLLKMFVLPLIISSLITGMAHMDARSSGRIGLRALVYYLVTTILAAIVGIAVVVTIHPGDPRIKNSIEAVPYVSSDTPKITTLDAILDIMRNMIPENLVQATFQQVQTTYVKKPSNLILQKNVNQSNKPTEVFQHTLVYRDGTNIMGMIVFCITFGLLVGQLGPKAKLLADFFSVINEIVMKIINMIILWYSPFGIMCLIAGKIISLSDIFVTAKVLGFYTITVISGLLIHGVITLPSIYWLMTRKNPATFFKGMIQAWIAAGATASSAVVLPITFRCLEENNKIDPRVTRFVVSIGATVNMDGTALYEAIAAIFIAQMNGITLYFGDLITVSLTATLASIGAASIPSSALVTIVLVLNSLGLPVNDVSLLFAVDWFLDRLRTSINVLGDGYGAGIVYELSKDELDQLSEPKKADGIEMGTQKDENDPDNANLTTETSHFNV